MQQPQHMHQTPPKPHHLMMVLEGTWGSGARAAAARTGSTRHKNATTHCNSSDTHMEHPQSPLTDHGVEKNAGVLRRGHLPRAKVPFSITAHQPTATTHCSSCNPFFGQPSLDLDHGAENNLGPQLGCCITGSFHPASKHTNTLQQS